MATIRTGVTGLLLFLVGVLVGANIVYFVLVRPAPPLDVKAAPSPQPVPSPARPETSARPAIAVGTPSVSPAHSAPVAAPTGLLIPVAGVAASQLTDTFNDHREGEAAHEALDIMAARGTPVLATADGSVAKLFTSVRGGLTIYEFDPTSTWAYYYAHLDRYAPDIVEGRQLHRGDVIGYVGSTGNANPSAPHLHFAIFVLGPEKRWWEGTAIDPFPLLSSSAR